jgi:hypothetical protein
MSEQVEVSMKYYGMTAEIIFLLASFRKGDPAAELFSSKLARDIIEANTCNSCEAYSKNPLHSNEFDCNGPNGQLGEQIHKRDGSMIFIAKALITSTKPPIDPKNIQGRINCHPKIT